MAYEESNDWWRHVAIKDQGHDPIKRLEPSISKTVGDAI